MSNLAGRVAVVSGGSTGIGLAIAQGFVAEGGHAFIFGLRKAQFPARSKRIQRASTSRISGTCFRTTICWTALRQSRSSCSTVRSSRQRCPALRWAICRRPARGLARGQFETSQGMILIGSLESRPCRPGDAPNEHLPVQLIRIPLGASAWFVGAALAMALLPTSAAADGSGETVVDLHTAAWLSDAEADLSHSEPADAAGGASAVVIDRPLLP